MQPQATTEQRPGPLRRVVAGFAIALPMAFSIYWLVNATDSHRFALGSLWFLAVLPAILSALICFLGDPYNAQETVYYFLVPLGLITCVDAASAVFLQEGVICLLMVSPIWLVFGWVGAFILRSFRTPRNPNATYCTLLFLPLTAGLMESQIPFPHDQVKLTRQILVHATPTEIWPFTVATAHIGPTEGEWNITQNIIGFPRPIETIMHGTGIGAVRTAYWQNHISFDEKITQWQPGKTIGWDFVFNNSSLQDYTDKHISPDGQFLKIASGGYTLQPLSPTITRVTLTTTYIAKTHVNAYAALWGEFLLGDVERNILAIIKHRAEAASPLSSPSPFAGYQIHT